MKCKHNWKQVIEKGYNSNPYFFCSHCLKIVYIDLYNEMERFAKSQEGETK